MFKQSKTTTDGVVYRRVVEEVLAPPSNSKKSKHRLEIEEGVFDLHDSVADTTKWLSLLSSIVSRMYQVLPESQKSQITQTERDVIEYAITKFNNSTTRADVQLVSEGTDLIDKIFDRQTKLAEIIK